MIHDTEITGLYTMTEMSRFLGVGLCVVKYRVKELRLKPEKTIKWTNYFSPSDYFQIETFNCKIVEKTIVEVIHRSQTFYIIESKMNYMKKLK